MKINESLAMCLLAPKFHQLAEQERENLLIAVSVLEGKATTDRVTRLVTGNKKRPYTEAVPEHYSRVKRQLQILQVEGYVTSVGPAGWAGNYWASTPQGDEMLVTSFNYQLLIGSNV
jgi:hypothetical protein